VELTRSHLASEEALSSMREKKSKVEADLDQTREELRMYVHIYFTSNAKSGF